jgi:hypothetical protein
MANTYANIASTTLSSSQTSVTFSSISSAYTDLVIRYSARSANTVIDYLNVQFNGVTNTTYSYTVLSWTGSSVSSVRGTNTIEIQFAFQTSADLTADTFGSGEIYIPSYNVSANKQIGIYGTRENNATASRIGPVAGLWRNTAAITSITLTSHASTNFAAGSSFYLYGIKNT